MRLSAKPEKHETGLTLSRFHAFAQSRKNALLRERDSCQPVANRLGSILQDARIGSSTAC